MRQSWWKILGVLIMLYVLTVGMLTPLKPGITDISGSQVRAGRPAILGISGYNTHFLEGDTKVWLKLDSDNIIEANSVKAQSDTQLGATFRIPEYFPGIDKVHQLTLITYNKVDGPSVLPNAVTVTGAQQLANSWSAADLSMLADKPGMQFPYRSILNETIRNTFFHIPLWFSMLILLLGGLWYSIKYMRYKNIDDDIVASSVTTVAILFGLLGIVTGSIWARFTWGAWWSPDVKLNMSATAMLIYCAYLVLRSSVTDRDRKAQLSAAYSIFAFVALIPLIFVIPRLTDSLHPGNGGNPALGGEDMENTLRMVFYPAIIGFTLLGLWISSLAIRTRRLEDRYFEQEYD